MMILNALNFASAIWVKFCHARFLSASNEMPATANWPSTAIIHHFIKPTVDSVCATRAHLFAQNPLKVSTLRPFIFILYIKTYFY